VIAYPLTSPGCADVPSSDSSAAVMVRLARTPGHVVPGRRSSSEKISTRICRIGRSSPSALAMTASWSIRS
jgi:hypothetical protein